MNHLSTSLVLATIIGCSHAVRTDAQCVPLSSTVAGPVMVASIGLGGTDNRSGIAYNPDADLYYSVDAGSAGYPVDTYDGGFNLIDSVVQAYDYRGAWWNAGTGQFEGNGYNGMGIFVQDLQVGNAHPMGAGAIVLASAQPESQSCGVHDPVSDEVVYYYDGGIHHYSRLSGALLGSATITGLPVTTASINTSSIAFIGCPGHEYGIYDFTDRRLLFIDRTTNSYTGFCQLPIDAPARSFLGMAYANGRLWLFEQNAWHGYVIVNSNVGVNDAEMIGAFSLAPNPASDDLYITPAGHAGSTMIDVIDALGRNVLSRPWNGVWGHAHVDVGGLHEGTYHLRPRSQYEVVVRSFVIAR